MAINSLDNYRRNEPIRALQGKQSTRGLDVWRRNEPARQLVAATTAAPGASARVQVVWMS